MNGNNFARFLHDQLYHNFESDIFRDLTFYKFLTVIFLVILIIALKSAEQLKYPSLFSTLAILISLIVFWTFNAIKKGFVNLKNVKMANWNQALPLVASQVYSIESVGTILTIRNAMKNPSKMSFLLKIVFSIAILLFLVNGWSFQLTYKDPIEIGFDYFAKGNALILTLQICFYLTLPATICITMFALLTVFENIPGFENQFGVEDSPNFQESLISNHLSKEDIIISNQKKFNLQKINTESKNCLNMQKKRKSKEVSYFQILKMRLMICGILFFPFFLNINEYFLILMTGSLISPCLGFVFPVIAYNYRFSQLGEISISAKVLNYFILIVGVGMNLAAFVHTVTQKN